MTTTSWSGLFLEWTTGMNDYITRHAANYARIQTCLDYLHAMSGGAISLFDVPNGLQEIFDRDGVIGYASYMYQSPALVAPDYILTILKGACYVNGNFYRKATSTSINMKDAVTGDYYLNIDAAGNPSVSDIPGNVCIYKFHYSTTTHGITNWLKNTGISILFDGDDYNACLYSSFFVTSYTSIAARFQALETYMSNVGGLPEDYDVADSHPSENPNAVSPHLYLKVGRCRNDNVVITSSYTEPDGTIKITLTTSDGNEVNNYVEVDPADGTLYVIVEDGFTSGRIPLWQIHIYRHLVGGQWLNNYLIADKRCWLSAGGGGGGGGGHTQNTDTGSTSYDFTLGLAVSGAPSHDMRFRVKRGTSPTVDVRWNETIDKWQWTEDGSIYHNFGDITLDLGQQEISKYVAIEDPQLVVNDVGRGTSVAYEDIDLNSFIDAPDGVAAVVLRVIFLDSADPADVANHVRFKPKGAMADPAIAYTVYTPANRDFTRPQTLIIGTSSDNFLQYYVATSGIDTANVAVFLVGYFKKILGVGSQNKLFGESGLVGVKNTITTFELPGFCNRGLVRSFSIKQTTLGAGEPYGTYNVRVYGKSPFNRDQLMYEAIDLTLDGSEWLDMLPWFYYNEDSNSKLYMEIENKATNYDGTFDIAVKAEMFA